MGYGVLYLLNIWTGYYSNNKEERRKTIATVFKRLILLAGIFFLNYHFSNKLLLTYMFRVFQ